MTKKQPKAKVTKAQSALPVWSKGPTEETITIGEGEYLSNVTLRSLNYDVFTHCQQQTNPDEFFFRLGLVSVDNMQFDDGAMFELEFGEHTINGDKYPYLSDASWSVMKENTTVMLLVMNTIKSLSGLTLQDIKALKFFRSPKGNKVQ